MWEKIKANSHFVYFGVIVVGYLSYAIYSYGFDEFILGYFRSEDDYKINTGPGGFSFYPYFNLLLGPFFGSLIWIAYLHFTDSKYAKLAGQIFAILLVILLIYLRKNL